MVAAQRVKQWWEHVPQLLKIGGAVLTLAVSIAATSFARGVVRGQGTVADSVSVHSADIQLLKQADVSHDEQLDSLMRLMVPVSCFTKANAQIPGYTRDVCALSPKP